MDEMMRKEVEEAIDAGERALWSLRAAQDNLNSAKNWGIVDLFGGGFFTDVIKHSKMEKASQCMEQAKYDLQRFQRELRDVDVVMNLNMNISDFLTFADFFFDGLIADYMVQSRIGEARSQVAEAIQRVRYLVEDMRRRL